MVIPSQWEWSTLSGLVAVGLPRPLGLGGGGVPVYKLFVPLLNLMESSVGHCLKWALEDVVGALAPAFPSKHQSHYFVTLSCSGFLLLLCRLGKQLCLAP